MKHTPINLQWRKQTAQLTVTDNPKADSLILFQATTMEEGANSFEVGGRAAILALRDALLKAYPLAS